MEYALGSSSTGRPHRICAIPDLGGGQRHGTSSVVYACFGAEWKFHCRLVCLMFLCFGCICSGWTSPNGNWELSYSNVELQRGTKFLWSVGSAMIIIRLRKFYQSTPRSPAPQFPKHHARPRALLAHLMNMRTCNTVWADLLIRYHLSQSNRPHLSLIADMTVR